MAQIVGNVPEALQPLFSCVEKVERMFDRINVNVDEITDTAAEMVAMAVPLYIFGDKPEYSREFWFEVAKAGGKNHQGCLVNYMLKAHSKGMDERIGFFKVKSQMISTLNWFTTPECYPAVHATTEGDVLDEIKKQGGILNIHRMWGKYINKKEREESKAREEHEAQFQKWRREQDAAAKGFQSVAELDAWEAQEHDRQTREIEAGKWLKYVIRGTVAADKWTDDGDFYIKHDGKLIRLSDLDAEAIRACMIR